MIFLLLSVVIGIPSLRDWLHHILNTPDVTGAIGFPALQAGLSGILIKFDHFKPFNNLYTSKMRSCV